MIRAVIFDYFGVICSDEYWNLVKADKNMTSDWLNMANRVNLGKLPWADFLKHIAKRTGKTLEEVKNLYRNERINPELIELIHTLKSKYKIGLLTNAHHEFLEPILKETGLVKLFDSIVVSSRAGYIKPDQRIFELALDELDVKPGETIFIDDIKRNTIVAEEMGIKSVLYHDLVQLKDKLSVVL